MFATITKFQDEKIQGMTSVHTERLVETKETESRSIPIKSGAWYSISYFILIDRMIDFYNSYYGQLTNLGRYRMTSLGDRIREVYINK
jgi:acid phosphatase